MMQIADSTRIQNEVVNKTKAIHEGVAEPEEEKPVSEVEEDKEEDKLLADSDVESPSMVQVSGRDGTCTRKLGW